MKIFHLSDLHLGKSVHEFSMIEDQKYILNEIQKAVVRENPSAVLISGDVFDRSVPSAEALKLFDDFIDFLVALKIKVFVIAGNHDSGDRLSFGSRMFTKSGVYIEGIYDGETLPYILKEMDLEVKVYMIPFIRPINVRRFFENEETVLPSLSYNDALQLVINSMDIDKERINILLTHQFVTGAVTSDSEEFSVGSLDNVDSSIFEPFDYVALGHLHRPQSIRRSTIRYSGSPLKYSFSEASNTKTITVVDIKGKDDITIKELPLKPLRDMCEIKGKYLDITSRNFYRTLDTENYYKIVLTDEESQPDVLAKLRIIYPNIMYLEYDNTRTRTNSNVMELDSNEKEYLPIEIFDLFYKEQNGRNLSDIQKDYLQDVMEQVFSEVKE